MEDVAPAFQARAAFQKTASDMEHERINLMSVITQAKRADLLLEVWRCTSIHIC